MPLTKRHLQIAILSLATIYLFLHTVPASFRSDPGSPATKDFMPVYSGARCLIHGCNPYLIPDIQNQFLQSGALSTQLPNWQDETPVYSPATFLVLSPMAPMPFPRARILWVIANAALLAIAAWLAWLYTLPDFSWVTTIVAAGYILTSRTMLALGQPACATIALFIIATAFFLKERHLNWATVALLLSLTIKPQIAGLAILYLLWQRIHWKRIATAAAGALLVLVVACAILQTRPASKSWLHDWQTNLTESVSPNSINDPRPEYAGAFSDIHLDTLTSLYSRDARIYRPASLIIFFVLVLIWLYSVHRSTIAGKIDHALALSALAVLSLLPIYHRLYDADILLLIVLAIPSIFRMSRILGILSLIPIYLLNSETYATFVKGVILPHISMVDLMHKPLLFILLLRERNLMLLLEFAILCYLLVRKPVFTPNITQQKLSYDAVAS